MRLFSLVAALCLATTGASAHGFGGGHFGGFHGFGHGMPHGVSHGMGNFSHSTRGSFGDHHGGNHRFGDRDGGHGSHLSSREHDFRDHVGPMDFGGPVDHRFNPEHHHGRGQDRDLAGGGEGLNVLCPLVSVASFATPYAAPLSIMCAFAD